jgi:hypothetical protein
VSLKQDSGICGARPRVLTSMESGSSRRLLASKSWRAVMLSKTFVSKRNFCGGDAYEHDVGDILFFENELAPVIAGKIESHLTRATTSSTAHSGRLKKEDAQNLKRSDKQFN